MRFVAVVMLAVYSFLAPACAFAALGCWVRARLRRPSGEAYTPLYESERPARRREPSAFSMLLSGYRDCVWWWEATVVGRTG